MHVDLIAVPGCVCYSCFLDLSLLAGHLGLCQFEVLLTSNRNCLTHTHALKNVLKYLGGDMESQESEQPDVMKD